MKILLITCLLAAMASALPPADEKIRQFMDAVRKADLGAIGTLLAGAPALVNAKGADGVTAVRLAIYYRHPEIARILVERGAALDIYDAAASGNVERLNELDPDRTLANTRSADGATLLGLAAFFGHREAVQFLLDRGAQIDLLSTNPAFPFAPLHSAISAGHRDIVDLLLARGANVNVREGGGMTALDEAAALGNVEYVQLLLAHGADPNARTDEGRLPEDFARERGHGVVVEMLEKARKDPNH